MILDLHHVPGRLLVRLAALKGNRPAAAPLRSELILLEGVRTVSVNSHTGSVIVHYAKDEFEPEVFWGALRRAGYIGEGAHPWVIPTQKPAGVAATAAWALLEIAAGDIIERWIGHSASKIIKLAVWKGA